MSDRPNNKKICLLVHSLAFGGKERVLSQLANYLSKQKGVLVNIIIYGKDRRVDFPLSSSISISKPGFQFDDHFRIISTIKTAFYLRRMVTEIKPDCLLTFGEYWNSFVLLSLCGLSYPVFISDRSCPDKKLGFPYEILRNWLYPKARGLIAQTQKAMAIAAANKRNSNIRVIGNPIRNIEQNSSTSRENIVLTVSRLVRTKHLDRLIRIFVGLNKPQWKLVIVGGDAQKQNQMNALRQLVDQLNATENVILAGSQEDVDDYYRRCKIFAFTSSSEGFPNVVGEALSAGLPVVSYDCVAGPSEMIRDGENGFLVPVFDDDLFASRLKSLMDDETLRERMGERGRESVARFSVDIIGEQYYDFITTA